MRKVSLRLSVKRVHCDKMEERYVQIFVSYETSFKPTFSEKNGWWGQPFYLKFCVNRPPILNRNSLVAPQP